jgi:hypothetical protein
MIKLLLNILFWASYILTANTSQNTDTVNAEDKIPVNFYLQAGGIMPTGGIDFFDAYGEFIGGRKRQFHKTPSLYAGARLLLNENLRLNISAGYFNAQIEEFYNQQYENKVEKSSRDISQSISVHNIPIVASFEYIPFNLPYKTFIGLGAGLDIGSLKWEELIEPGSNIDQRKGGEWGHDNLLSPLLRISTGVNLMFDRHHPDYILQNFLIELRYNLLYRNKKFFEEINKQFYSEYDALKKSYFLLPAYLELVVGISLNFDGT